MDSNADHAQHGDTIEITSPARVDFGKRMQVATCGDLAVTALDNRLRVRIEHGEYRIVKRCGKPASTDLPKRGRPTNAERAARAATQTPPAVEIPPAPVTPRVSDNDVAALELAIDRANAIGIQKSASEAASRATDAVTKAADAKASPATVGTPIAWQLVNPDTTARGTQQLDAAASAAAIGVDIDKPHKAAQDVKREQMQEQAQQRNEMLRKRLADVAELQNTPSAAAPAAHDSQASAPAEHGIADKPGLGKPETASAGVGDLIELTAPIAGYHGGAWLEVLARINENTVKALGPCGDDQPIFVLDSAYKVVQRAEDMSARARMAVRQFNQSMQSDHMADAIVSGLGIQRVWMDDDLVKRGTIPPAEWLRPDLSHLTQEQIDERTTKPDPIVCGSDYTVFMAGRQVGKTFALKHSHYFKPCPFDHIDVYRVLERFNVADPCLQHAIKKLLVAGGRGAKDIGQDVQEAIDTLERFKAMRKEEAA